MDYPGKIITKNTVEPSQTSAPGVWTLDQATQAVENNTWPIANVPAPISRSLRFNSADSTYLNRTPATAGNRQTWTWSGWVKRSALGSTQSLFAVNDTTNYQDFRFTSSDTLFLYMEVDVYGYAVEVPTVVWRDPSAWYHIVLAVDTTQATSTNRVKIYVNGVQQTVAAASGFSFPAQNFNTFVNATIPHAMGNFNYNNSSYFSGYMTQIHFVDGQQLDASSFGLTDPRTGAWIPKAYTGTYGTNGFYLNFSDNSTTAALGTDYSGNNNTWTANNFSVTAGSGNDSLTDVPTPWIPYNTTGDVGGVVRGNYATLNPLAKFKNGTSFFTSGDLSNGNLQVTLNADNEFSIATWNGQSGKWYSEFTVTNLAQRASIGVLSDSFDAGTLQNTRSDAGGSVTGDQSWTTGDVIQIAIDYDNSKVWFGKNNTWYNSGNPATNTNGTSLSFTVSGIACWQVSTSTGNTVLQFNAGQRPFAYTPPAGFKSLCTTNLPEPTILDGGEYFNAVLWTGNSSTQSITGVGFQPDFVWLKSRTNVASHRLSDAVRGVNKQLATNATDAESTFTTMLTSFDSDGFTLGDNVGINGSGYTNVGWCWKESATSGFDIVTYTGTGVVRTVNHNLGVAPSMMIIKCRNAAGDNWRVYHSSLGATKFLDLNQTSSVGTATSVWNDTAPTSTVFTVGTNGEVNRNAGTYVAYLFAAVPGFSAFGSYTGNGSSDGPFVYTGFRPAFVLFKLSSGVNDWIIMDSARNTYNVVGNYLKPDTNEAEASYSVVDFLSSGFKIRNTSTGWNGSGATYIYACFAENPFKYSNAR